MKSGEADRSRPAVARGQLRIVDLFSSVGGLSIGAVEGARLLGYDTKALFAADVDERALGVYRRNLSPINYSSSSVRGMLDFRVSGQGKKAQFSYPPEVIDDSLGMFSGSVDMLLAGPPCQGHSSLNNHSRHDDPKNRLYLTAAAAAVALGAQHVVIENVPNVTADKNSVVETTIALLKSSGYTVEHGVLSADKLGWPQTRRRFFAVASRGSSPIPLASVQSELLTSPRPVSWLLEDPQVVVSESSDVMNTSPDLSQENKDRIQWLFENDAYDLPNEIRPDCHRNGTTYKATYGRMRGELPAPTITGGFLSPGRGRFVHPTLRRVLTPREAARIQGFPDWFNFDPATGSSANRTEVAKWIGNAVPSVLGFAAALSPLLGELEQ